MIEDVCRKIKEKRREAGYSLEYVVEKTKLYPSVIKDIEAGNLTNINAAYLRGFVKIYAAFLNVDLGNALEEIERLKEEQSKPKPYKIKKKEPDPPPVPASNKPAPDKPLKPELKKNLLATMVGIVILAFVLVLGIFIVKTISGIFFKPSASNNADLQEKAVFDETNKLTVSLTAKKKCFIQVSVDGKFIFEGILEKGAVDSWNADKEIEFKISDGSAIYLEVNGKPIPTLTAIRRPIKSLKITPSGISVDK
jgi:transcriptional regulator with XRE-family HTH domain